MTMDQKNLAAGEEYDLIFDVTIPEDLTPNIYGLNVSLNCSETSKGVGFNVEVLERKIGFEMLDASRQGENQVKVIYTLEEFSGIDQDVEMQFILFNDGGGKEAELKETRFISSYTKSEFETVILITPELEGDLSLLINFNSETYSGFVEEDIVFLGEL